MQRLEVSGAVRLIYRSLGFKGISLWGYTYGRHYLYSLTTVSVVTVRQPNALNSDF